MGTLRCRRINITYMNNYYSAVETFWSGRGPLALVESGQRLTHQLRPGAAPRSEPDESTPTRRARIARIQNPLP